MKTAGGLYWLTIVSNGGFGISRAEPAGSTTRKLDTFSGSANTIRA